MQSLSFKDKFLILNFLSPLILVMVLVFIPLDKNAVVRLVKFHLKFLIFLHASSQIPRIVNNVVI